MPFGSGVREKTEARAAKCKSLDARDMGLALPECEYQQGT